MFEGPLFGSYDSKPLRQEVFERNARLPGKLTGTEKLAAEAPFKEPDMA